MAKRTGGGGGEKDDTKRGESDWRLLLAAAVIEYGRRRVIGPYTLTIPKRAMRAATPEGVLSETELPNGDRLLKYTPPRETPPAKPKR